MAHRRSVVLAAIFITILIVFIFHQSSASSSYYRDVFTRRHSLKTWLNDEEERYTAFLQDRKQFITKWGPEVEPYPADQLYTLWDFFIPSFQCPHRIDRIGALGDGGKWVCGVDRIAKQDKCVIYSFGVNLDSSFEADLLKRAPGCEVWGYDYSVDGWGPEINDTNLKHRAHFQPWALGGTDQHGLRDDPMVWTLDSIMKHNGHNFIDILKIDIEGGEFESLTPFVAAHTEGVFPVGQLQLEIHAQFGRERSNYFFKWFSALEAVGLRPFSAEPNLVYVDITGAPPQLSEYAFINIRGDHALVNEAFN